MSNVLWFPLVLGILLSAYIAYRTHDRVRRRAIGACAAVVAAFSLTYVPELSGEYAIFGTRITDFVAYTIGEGSLSQVWLSAIVVDAIRRFTRTRVGEVGWLGWMLDATVILGFAWVFWSFITGHPIEAFG
jgi:hypothetical protein